ncbi:uncharacterized protein LOC128882153 [Hylaeus volcanicus]|uniref:uncharacterized protein LOC128882153 n=1 Tax=Hylaeus volcanicus TaxID=313075 RepID=UPI0023B79251|nr:uncharacterized protein LOC128882153 [Hylaeus volcanicus]
MFRNRYMNDVENIYKIHFTVLMVIIISSLTVTMLKVSKLEPSAEFYQSLAFTLAQVAHLLVFAIQGQFVMDAGNDIYDAVWESLWYNGSCKIQALYVLILRRSLIPPQFTIGGLISMNLRSFVEIVKVSVSYLTVLQST